MRTWKTVCCLNLALSFVVLYAAVPFASRVVDAQNANQIQPQAYFTEPALSPDRKEIAFVSGGDIWTVPSAGGVAALLVSHAANEARPLYSPDGKELFISPQLRETGTDIWVKTLGDDSEPRKLFSSSANEGGARLAPDSRWILMTSDESGREEVYVYPYPSLSGRWQVSSEGGRSGSWLPGGRTILYATLDRRLVRVDVDGSGESFRVGEEKTVFGGHTIPGLGGPAPDGKRVLLAVPQGGSSLELHLVTHWQSLLDGRGAR